MEVNKLPDHDTTDNTTGCCPRFDPKGWDHRTLHFKDKLFVRATSKSVMHVPMNMGAVFSRVQNRMETDGAFDPRNMLTLSRDLSPWEAEHYFAATGDVEGEEMVRLSGTFITRVFEGPYRYAAEWAHEMDVAARAMGHEARRIFMFYTTCPRCAEAYGENYVVGLAEI
ncbi:hydrolase [Roseovarius sp.]|uniref:hydrolase n=1 Tax=Roseovarius sp. TaxID=1486281 RepID=UPI0026291D04|nr:hydrolase [Roseovarius sp.]